MLRIFIAICLSGAALWAQSFTASVTGTVTDSSGGVIPQATSWLSIPQRMGAPWRALMPRATTRSCNSSPGTYTLEVSAPGFKKLLRGSVVLEVQQQVAPKFSPC